MSILNLAAPPATPAPLTPEEQLQLRLSNMAKRNAEVAVASAVASTSSLVDNLLTGLDVIWASESPSAVLAEIGTDAVELFAISRDVATFLIPQLTGKRDDSITAINTAFSRMKPYTEHADGTVTIN